MRPKAKRIVLLTKNVIKNPTRAVSKVTRKLSSEGLTGFMYAVKNKLIVNQNAPTNKINDMNEAYQTWRIDNSLSDRDLNTQREESKNFKKKPVISIITPVYKPPTDVLEDLIKSVLNQTYPYFELCIAEVAQNEESIALLKKYQKIDNRIKVRFMPTNGGIATDSNACLEQATGDYIALLDHDDLISPDALYENAKMINEDDYDFIYSDKDKIDENGRHYEPMFKPDWSPEIMFNSNYLTHLNVFKHSLIKKIGGWQTNTDGAQDWDLFLRLIKVSKKVGHIPKVLYHWRVLETSTAHSIMAKPYALEGQRNAITYSAKKAGLDVTVTHTKDGFLNLHWKNQRVNQKILILFITDLDDTTSKERLSKQLKGVNFDYSVVTIDSRDGKKFLSSIRDKKPDQDLLVLNSNVNSKISTQQIHEVAGWLSIPEVAVASPHIKDHNGGLFDVGRILGFRSLFGPIYSEGTYTPSIFGFHEWVRNTSAGSPFFSLIKSSALSKINKDLYCEETDSVLDIFWKINLLLRASDFRIVSTPYVTLNIEKETSGQEDAPSLSVVKLAEKYFSKTIGDGYFNPNLSLLLSGPQFDERNITSDSRKEQFLKNLQKGADLRPYFSEIQGNNDEDQSQYQNEANNLSAQYDFSQEDIDLSIKAANSTGKISSIDSAIWFIPMFESLYAGLKNIFALANELTMREETRHTFILNSNVSIKIPKKLVISQFPALKDSRFIASRNSSTIDIESSTIAICTLWTTAYDMLKYNKTKRKCYILQDWEPDFYPKGTLSAMSEATYDFGYLALAGTKALGTRYEQYNKNNDSTYLPSLLDLSDYINHTKSKAQSAPLYANKKVKRVMFYGRPDSPRNGFELGIAALTKLKTKLGDDIEIVIAGAQSYSKSYKLEEKGLSVAGKVPYTDLKDFYSSFDACLFLMFSQHPGVIPLEMMASGVPVVINDNKSSDWSDLYKNNQNCIISRNSPTEIANSIFNVLNDNKVREKLISNGLKQAKDYGEKRYQDAVMEVINKIKG
ncbi:MAG: glycosyltransferase [Candidatus Nomurabacteria bacterium]|nr:MAG: glycosyltransferase [Candidatus Nomurabacteria bacterium]